MIKKIITLFIIILFTAPLCSLSWNVPDETIQGAVLKILLWNDLPVEGSVSASLMSSGRTYTESDSFFPFNRGAEEPWIGVILLGVPSDMPSGGGEVALNFGGEDEITLSILIHPGEFVREEIPLNTEMSTLRQEDDTEKARQWRVLYSLLTTFNSGAVFLNTPFSLPVSQDARRTSYYGDRRIFLYTDGNTARSIHQGIDFSGVPGTSVRAAGPGKVVFSGLRILSGETIVIEHLPGVYSSYYHMTDRFMTEGDTVTDQQLMGTIGATGLVTGAHLHWEIRVNGVSVSPDLLMTEPLIDKTRFLSIINKR